jgi:hypothetical protein
MKCTTPEMEAHLRGCLTTLATCWKITRKDGQVFAYTDHDRNIVFTGQLYKACLSYSRTAVRTTADFSVDNLDVQGVLDATEITEIDLEAGIWDNARVEIFAVNWADLTMEDVKLRAGWIGKVSMGQNQYTAELRGLAQALQTQIGEVYQPGCRNDLGDAHCGFDLSTVTAAGAVTAVSSNRVFAVSGLTQPGPTSIDYTANTIGFFPNRITDLANGFIAAGIERFDTITISGSAFNDKTVSALKVFDGQINVALQALTRERAGNAITLSVRQPGYYDLGLITFTSGLNTGLTQEVRTWVPNVISLARPMPFLVQVGDTFTITPGCDKRITTCVKKFDNLLGPDGLHGGIRAEPFVPGQDAALDYANARS